jgi:hypothetical protein
MIEIDGSQGEGGGQIVRSSLTLAAETAKQCLSPACAPEGRSSACRLST